MRDGVERANQRLRSEAAKHRTLIAAHRGTCGGHIIENTTQAYRCALHHRADIIELDVARSADNKLFIFHDGNERRLLHADRNIRTMTSDEILSYSYHNQTNQPTKLRVNTFDEALESLKGRCLINVDRSWKDWELVLPCIEAHGMLDQCIVKSDPEEEHIAFLERYDAPILYMPKAFCVQDVERVLARNVNVVAFEVIFFDDSADTLDPMAQKSWHDRGVLLWGNVLRLKDDWNRSAWHDDNGAILEDPDSHWGWMVDHGFDILQTDWPLLLHDYLVTRGNRA